MHAGIWLNLLDAEPAVGGNAKTASSSLTCPAILYPTRDDAQPAPVGLNPGLGKDIRVVRTYAAWPTSL